MKTLYTRLTAFLANILIFAVFSGINVYGQTPAYFNFQAALRDASGNLISNSTVGVQLVILQGSVEGTEVYDETHNVTTNTLGMVTLAVGSKDPSGFGEINWSEGPYFLKVTVNGNVMGTSQILSVPYALMAKTMEHLTFPYIDSASVPEAPTLKIKNLGEGKTSGIWGETSSASGIGVRGQGIVYGMWGETTGPRSRGVIGKALDERSIGVYGIALGDNSSGVFGEGKIYDFYANGPGVDYGTGSSIRWKKNVAPIVSPLEKVQAIRGVTFDWDAEHGGKHDVGMIAEEVGKVLPEIVVYEENGIDAIGMDYSKITPLLLEAIKAQQTEIEALKEELTGLKVRLDAGESK
jgi:hypothetical protein